MLSHIVRQQPSRMCALSSTVLLYEDRRRTPCEIRWLDCSVSPPKPFAGKSVTFTKQDAVWDMCCVKDNDDEDLLVTTRGYVGMFAYKLKTDERVWRVKGRRASKKGKEIGVESITTDGRGHLYVCGLDECVWIFSTSGNFLATLMRQKSRDTVQPWSVSWCLETSSLVVAHTKAKDKKYYISNIREILETQQKDARKNLTETQSEVFKEMATEARRDARKNTTNATEKAEQFLADLRQELYVRSSAVEEQGTPAPEELEMSATEENTENLLNLRDKLLEELAQVPDSEKEVTTTDDSQNTVAEESTSEEDAITATNDAAVENRGKNVPAKEVEECPASATEAEEAKKTQENLRADNAISNTETETSKTTQKSKPHALAVKALGSAGESANAVNVVQSGNDALAATTTTADGEVPTDEATVPEPSALMDHSTRDNTETVENNTVTTAQGDRVTTDHSPTTEVHGLVTTENPSALSTPEDPTGQPDKQADELEQADFEEGKVCDSTANTDTGTGNDAHIEPEPMDTADNFTEAAVTAPSETAEIGPSDAASTSDDRREDTNVATTADTETTAGPAKDRMDTEEDYISAAVTQNSAEDVMRDEQKVTTSAVAELATANVVEETAVSTTTVNESLETVEDSSEITKDTSVIDVKATMDREMEKTSISFNYKGKRAIILERKRNFFLIFTDTHCRHTIGKSEYTSLTSLSDQKKYTLWCIHTARD